MPSARFIVSYLWSWWGVGVIGAFFLAAAVTAMYSNDFIGTAVLFFGGTVIFCAKAWTTPETKDHENRQVVRAMIVVLGAVLFCFFLGWDRHQYFKIEAVNQPKVDIEVSLSSPEFQFQGNDGVPPPMTMPNGRVATAEPALLIIGNCNFTNRGAGSGEVEQLAINFLAEDGTKWSFLPYKLLDNAALISVPGGYLEYDSKHAPPFSSIAVAGKQTAHHAFLFLADDFHARDLVPHKFKVSLVARFAGDHEPRQQQVSTLDFNSDVVQLIKTGMMNNVPFEEERENARQMQ